MNHGITCTIHLKPAFNRLRCVRKEPGCPILRQSDPQDPPPHPLEPRGSWTSQGDVCFFFQGMGAGVGQLPLIKLTELLRQPGLACNNPPLLP